MTLIAAAWYSHVLNLIVLGLGLLLMLIVPPPLTIVVPAGNPAPETVSPLKVAKPAGAVMTLIPLTSDAP